MPGNILKVGCYGLLAVVWILLIFFPILSIFDSVAVSDLVAGLGSPIVLKSIKVSAVSSGVSILVVVILGLPTAYFLSRYDFPGKMFLDTLLEIPMVLPPAVSGIALLLTFGRRGIIGGWLSGIGVNIPFSLAAVVVAQIFVAVPFFIRTVKCGFRGINKNMEKAAQTLGKSPWQVFLKVTLPLAMPSVISGTVMAWARALGEFGATLMFAGNMPDRTQTLPLAVYTAMETDFAAAMTISAIMVLISFFVLVLVKTISGKEPV